MEAKFREASQNQLRKWSRLADAKFRREEGLFIAEGVKVVGELLESGRPLEALLVMPEKKPYWERAIAAAGDEIPVYRTGRREYKKLSQDKEPEGLLAVAKQEAPLPLEDFLSHTAGAILILDAINNPANLGALARSASWFGFDGIIIGSESVDWTNPRAVRASMGSIFHMRIMADVKLAAAVPEIKKHLPVIAGDARRGEEPRPLSQRAALLLGSESHGLPEELLALADKRWRIPGGGKTESLSLPQAGAIMMYEMRREG